MAGLRMSVVVSATSFLLGMSLPFSTRALALPATERVADMFRSHRRARPLDAIYPSTLPVVLYTCTGLLFTHWIADSLTLWKSPETQTDSRLWTAATYYSILMHGVPQLAYLYAAVALVGGVTILWSLRDGRAGNLMFDGGSICECRSTLHVCVPLD